jgi:hypothetical protein
LIFSKIIPNIPIIKDLLAHPKKLFCKLLCLLLSLPFKRTGNNQGLSNKTYYEQFGINTIKNPATDDYFPISPYNMKLLKAAYQKAWECRNFEIDKSWSRSAYFWGFIALIFTGYVVLLKADPKKIMVDIKYLKYVSLYLILSGFLFSLAWFLVIRGSKALQENWEEHIDRLEDLITGPLYKTLFSPIRPHYYSVSKINEVIAIVTIIIWVGLYIQYIQSNNFYLLLNLFNKKIDWYVTIPLVITIFISIVLQFGYPVTDYNLNQDSLNELKKQKLKGAFIRRDKKKEASP